MLTARRARVGGHSMGRAGA